MPTELPTRNACRHRFTGLTNDSKWFHSFLDILEVRFKAGVMSSSPCEATCSERPEKHDVPWTLAPISKPINDTFLRRSAARLAMTCLSWRPRKDTHIFELEDLLQGGEASERAICHAACKITNECTGSPCLDSLDRSERQDSSGDAKNQGAGTWSALGPLQR